jgi:hypothetical protein
LIRLLACALLFAACGGVATNPPPTSAADRDHDGLSDDRDACPVVAEDRDGDQDDDGCPECTYSDRDGDEVHEPHDACPDDPEDRDGDEDEDGCPDPDG